MSKIQEMQPHVMYDISFISTLIQKGKEKCLGNSRKTSPQCS